ncbi:MAG: hypothetical protein QOE99_2624 [Actinomycetota bacterium]|nr:hypothetical protein [Actinomycetota bacterium]
MHPLAWPTEDAQHLGGLLAITAEPVRYGGVELDDFSLAQEQVLRPQDEAHPTGQDVEPLRAIVDAQRGR